MGRGLHTQGDGRKPLPHIVTGLASVVLTLVLSHVAHLGGVGPAGPAGTAGKSATNAGICTTFGKDPHGHMRFQVYTPLPDGGCPAGQTFVSVVPGR